MRVSHLWSPKLGVGRPVLLLFFRDPMIIGIDMKPLSCQNSCEARVAKRVLATTGRDLDGRERTQRGTPALVRNGLAIVGTGNERSSRLITPLRLTAKC